MPGEMALLPTIESFDMPEDLVGDIKIKFKYSRKGLTPLFGPKVDPYFGNGHLDGERLYLWVSNLGLDPIDIKRGDRVFTVQFHQLFGEAPDFEKKVSIRRTVAQEAAEMRPEQSLGFIEEAERRVKLDLGTRLTRVEEGTGQVVIFGVFPSSFSTTGRSNRHAVRNDEFRCDLRRNFIRCVDEISRLGGYCMQRVLPWQLPSLCTLHFFFFFCAIFRLLKSPRS